MSRLVIRGMGNSYTMQVRSFSTNMAASINTVQVQSQQHHYPIRVDQPDMNFDVQFLNSQEKKLFQNFVRNHQMNALTRTITPPWATFWWPERDMYNWTGYINWYMAGSKRFTAAPSIQFTVKLVDSLVSSRTVVGSAGSTYSDVFGPQVPWGPSQMLPPVGMEGESGGLTPPTPPSSGGGGGSW